MKILAVESFEKTVTVQFPTDGDAHREGRFKARFKYLPREQVEDMMDEGWYTSKVLDTVLVSVSDIQDEDGKDMSADEALEAVKENTFTSTALVSAYYDAIFGGARAKNSKRSRSR